MKNDKKNDIFEVIKDARTNPIQQIETMEIGRAHV